MRRILIALCLLCGAFTLWAQEKPVVYMTKDISPEGLVRIYEALGVQPEGKVAVKISTGENGGHNYLKPELIKELVAKVNGTIVECNTAYPGNRNTSKAHWKTIKAHGFTEIAPVEIMDEHGEIKIPVQNTKHLQYDIVGKGIEKYDFMINLAHFKGHAMGGFGGVLKNQSIGIASSAGKAYIHTAGKTENTTRMWTIRTDQDEFIESMAEAAQAVHNYFKDRIVYIDVMNNLSVDCDCDAHPADPEMKDIGILASLDPVALDQACIDLVFNYPSTDGDNAAALIERVNSRHGIHILERAAEIGLGSREYTLVSIDENAVVENIMARRSIRKYKDQPVPREILDKILECGINAPNGMNQQNYEVKVVDDPASAAYLAENLRGLYKAPVYLFIAAGNQYDMSQIDVGLLAENICLSAWAYGIGSINLGQPVRALKDRPEILSSFGFSEGYDLCLVIALGYPDEAPAAKPRKADKVQFVDLSLLQKAEEIHSRILSIDTHTDAPLWWGDNYSLGDRKDNQVSIPKMIDGHLDAQFLAAFLSQKDKDKNIVEKCQALITSIYDQVAKYPDQAGIAVTEADARALKAQGKRAFFIGIENGYGIGNDLGNIKRFYDQGVNYITLCHSYDNAICHSSTYTEDETLGLTDFGRKVVKEMNRVGMMIDLSHASSGTFWDVIKLSSQPVICSHSGAKDVFFHDRNLDDEQLKALAKNGGVVQVCIFGSYLRADGGKADINDVVEHIDHCVKVAGIDHVGIGSDFDGGGGVIGCNGDDDMIQITVKLLEKGYTEEQIEKIWGGNFFRVMNACRK